MNADTPNGMARAPRNRSRERGTALIEFALVLPLLLVLTVAAVDFGRAFFVKNMLHQAAREGVRMLAVQQNPVDIEARIANVMNSSGVQTYTVTYPTVDENGQAIGDDHVCVRVATDFNWLFPGIFNLLGAGFTNPTTLAASAVMRDEL